jgi:flagellar motor switch protein FliG
LFTRITLPVTSFGEVTMQNLNAISQRRSNAPAPALSQQEKAAIVVRFLLSEGAELTLADLPDDLQAILAVQFGQMRPVDRNTLANVVAEFAGELEQIALLFPRDVAGALKALEGKISPQTAARLRKEAGVRQAGDPWDRLRAASADVLLPFLTSEAVEVAAVLLSKLDVAKAGTLLGRLPGTTARHIVYAMSRTNAVTPDTVYRIGMSLVLQLDATPDRAFTDDPENRVGAILNLSTSETRNDVLSGLDETDLSFADAVRRAIFTFANITDRIAPRDVPNIVRAVDQAALVSAFVHARAMGGDMQRAVDFMLANISTRLADGLRDEMQTLGKVKPKAGEDAMLAVTTAIRELEGSGTLFMQSIVPDEEE